MAAKFLAAGPAAVSLFFPDGIPVEDDNDVEVRDSLWSRST